VAMGRPEGREMAEEEDGRLLAAESERIETLDAHWCTSSSRSSRSSSGSKPRSDMERKE
jgi:hypothetical protein